MAKGVLTLLDRADVKKWKDRHQNMIGYIETILDEKHYLRDVKHVEGDEKKIEEDIKGREIREEIKDFRIILKNIAKARESFVGTLLSDFKVLSHLIYIQKKVIKDLKESRKVPHNIAVQEIKKINEDLGKLTSDLNEIRLIALQEEREAMK